MKKYCFDTSGISNPLEFMPRDIHESLWSNILEFIEGGNVATTKEVFDEMVYIPNGIGDFLNKPKEIVLLEVGDSTWDWQTYIGHVARTQDEYHDYISENNGNISGTVGLNDISIICLAKSLGLPLVSMEVLVPENSLKKRRIPNICKYESIEHLTFNDFLRKENFKF